MATLQHIVLGTIDTAIDISSVGSQMKTIAASESDMTAQNAAGGVIGWVRPDYVKMHTAWNSLRFVAFQLKYAVTGVTIPADAPKALVPDTSIYYFVNTEYTGEISMKVTDENGGQYSLVADCMRTPYHGVSFITGSALGGAQFDVAIFARNVFKRITYLEGNSVTYLIINHFSSGKLWVFNGVVQQGESSQFNWRENGAKYLLTRQTIMQPWGANWNNEYGGDYNSDFGPEFVPDFSVQPVIAGGDPEVTIMTIGTGASAGVPTVQRVRVHDIDAMNTINTQLGANILTWQPECKGIAVRWLNDLGGVDAWIFTPRSRYQRKAKTSGYVNLYSPDPYNVKDTINVYDIEGEDLLVLGVDCLPRKQYEILKWLAVSRDVAVFMPAVSVPENRWQSVTIDDYKVEDSAVQNAVDFEITIRLPKLNLQV